jgi:hypothetical protein
MIGRAIPHIMKPQISQAIRNLSFIKDCADLHVIQTKLDTIKIPGEHSEPNMLQRVMDIAASWFTTKPTPNEIAEARQAFFYGFAINFFYAIIEAKTDVVKIILANKRFIGTEHALLNSEEYMLNWRLHEIIDKRLLDTIKTDKLHLEACGVPSISSSLQSAYLWYYCCEQTYTILPFVSAAMNYIESSQDRYNMLRIMTPYMSPGNLQDNDLYPLTRLGYTIVGAENDTVRAITQDIQNAIAEKERHNAWEGKDRPREELYRHYGIMYSMLHSSRQWWHMFYSQQVIVVASHMPIKNLCPQMISYLLDFCEHRDIRAMAMSVYSMLKEQDKPDIPQACRVLQADAVDDKWWAWTGSYCPSGIINQVAQDGSIVVTPGVSIDSISMNYST